MRDLSALNPEQFESLDGAIFSVDSGAGEMSLQLDGVQRQPRLSQGRVAFSVFWLGAPGAGLLPQATRTLHHPDLGDLELFLVPVGQHDGRVRYQAVFS